MTTSTPSTIIIPDVNALLSQCLHVDTIAHASYVINDKCIVASEESRHKIIYELLIIHRLVENGCGLVVKGVASRSDLVRGHGFSWGTVRFILITYIVNDLYHFYCNHYYYVITRAHALLVIIVAVYRNKKIQQFIFMTA